VEADEQQVNLTRFQPVLPEKREFFLENQACSRRRRATGRQLQQQQNESAPIMFYSRRIA
jgi:hypothetical protein